MCVCIYIYKQIYIYIYIYIYVCVYVCLFVNASVIPTTNPIARPLLRAAAPPHAMSSGANPPEPSDLTVWKCLELRNENYGRISGLG